MQMTILIIETRIEHLKISFREAQTVLTKISPPYDLMIYLWFKTIQEVNEKLPRNDNYLIKYNKINV